MDQRCSCEQLMTLWQTLNSLNYYYIVEINHLGQEERTPILGGFRTRRWRIFVALRRRLRLSILATKSASPEPIASIRLNDKRDRWNSSKMWIALIEPDTCANKWNGKEWIKYRSSKIDMKDRCGIMNELMFQVLALTLSMLLGVATIYSIRIYLEL